MVSCSLRLSPVIRTRPHSRNNGNLASNRDEKDTKRGSIIVVKKKNRQKVSGMVVEVATRLLRSCISASFVLKDSPRISIQSQSIRGMRKMSLHQILSGSIDRLSSNRDFSIRAISSGKIDASTRTDRYSTIFHFPSRKKRWEFASHSLHLSLQSPVSPTR